MELSFETLWLRRICEDPDAASAALGLDSADQLIDRLADLRAADSLADLVVGRPTKIEARDATFDIAIGSKARLVATIVHRPIPLAADGDVDLQRVWRIKLISVEVTA